MGKNISLGLRQSIYYAILLGAIASFCHFAYSMSGESVIVALFCPVNESVWEHMKFMFFPLILWWIYMYITYRKSLDLKLDKIVILAGISGFVSVLLTLMITYTYSGIIGKHNVIVDILSVFVVFFLTLRLIDHISACIKPKKVYVYISIMIIIIMSVSFFVFTFNPPKLEVFRDSMTGLYGI